MKKSILIGLRVDPELKQHLEKEAEKQERSLSDTIYRILRAYFSSSKKKK